MNRRKSEKLILPVQEHIRRTMKNLLESWSKDSLSKHLALLKDSDDRESYLVKLKSVIGEYGLFKEVRDIFTEKEGNKYKIKFGWDDFERYLWAWDLFWDLAKVYFKWEEYKKDNWDWKFKNKDKEDLIILEGYEIEVKEEVSEEKSSEIELNTTVAEKQATTGEETSRE